jgi:hypothetical protein
MLPGNEQIAENRAERSNLRDRLGPDSSGQAKEYPL